MNFLKKIILITALFLQTVAFAQSAKGIFRVKLVFHTVVGNQPLIFDSNYTMPLGDTFSVTKFKYYIGHISFTDSGKSQKIFTDYFLVDENDSTSQTIVIQVPDRPFTNLEFNIGVDSTKNVSGVQTGALDPANGMFWTWNSGYIMAKLEGKSPQSKAPFGNITYHIGGFRQQDNVVRKISLNMSNVNRESSNVNRESSVVNGNVNRESSTVNGSVIGDSSQNSRLTSHDSRLTIHDSRLTIHESRLTPHEIIININVDLNKWFDGPHPIKIAEKAFCMSPGKMAMEIADNYANMFSIKSISVK